MISKSDKRRFEIYKGKIRAFLTGAFPTGQGTQNVCTTAGNFISWYIFKVHKTDKT